MRGPLGWSEPSCASTFFPRRRAMCALGVRAREHPDHRGPRVESSSAYSNTPREDPAVGSARQCRRDRRDRPTVASGCETTGSVAGSAVQRRSDRNPRYSGAVRHGDECEGGTTTPSRMAAFGRRTRRAEGRHWVGGGSTRRRSRCRRPAGRMACHTADDRFRHVRPEAVVGEGQLPRSSPNHAVAGGGLAVVIALIASICQVGRASHLGVVMARHRMLSYRSRHLPPWRFGSTARGLRRATFGILQGSWSARARHAGRPASGCIQGCS